MKVRSSVKPMCKYCQVIKRRKTIKRGRAHSRQSKCVPVIHVICSVDATHKQRQKH